MNYGNYPPYYRQSYYNAPQAPENAPYGVQYQQQINNRPLVQNQPTSEFNWVLNENEATAYPVAVNNSVILWDKYSPTIYIKSVNMQGVPSMRVLDFVERTSDNAPKIPTERTNGLNDRFVTIDAFNALKAEFDGLIARLNEKEEQEN